MVEIPCPHASTRTDTRGSDFQKSRFLDYADRFTIRFARNDKLLLVVATLRKRHGRIGKCRYLQGQVARVIRAAKSPAQAELERGTPQI